jgi:acetyltransferase-like isoleucine patch superfamily enzyme
MTNTDNDSHRRKNNIELTQILLSKMINEAFIEKKKLLIDVYVIESTKLSIDRLIDNIFDTIECKKGNYNYLGKYRTKNPIKSANIEIGFDQSSNNDICLNIYTYMSNIYYNDKITHPDYVFLLGDVHKLDELSYTDFFVNNVIIPGSFCRLKFIFYEISDDHINKTWDCK